MPPKIISDVAVSVVPGSQVPCSATGTPPIYIVLMRNYKVMMNTTNIASSKLYQEGNYTCVATSKYGSDEKHFVIKGGEKMRCFETNPMQRVAKRGWGSGYQSCIIWRRHAKLWAKIKVVTWVRFGLHPLDHWIIRLQGEGSKTGRVGFSPLQISIG